MKLIRVLSALGVFICFVLWVSQALASRNSSGTMAGINGPYVAGTVISSSVINARLADIETELTDSASRSGKGGFTAPVRGADGTVTAPTFAFTSETGTGIYRIGASDLGVAINQSKKLELTSSLFTVSSGVSVGIGASAGTLLDVEGTHVANKGLIYAKGVSGHGYIIADTDSPTTKEAGFTIDNNGTALWSIYKPANSSDLRFNNGTDRVIMSSSGLTIGASGTAIATISAGSCTLNGGTPATCTATVVSGAKCVASKVQTGGGTAQSVSVTTTTLTVTSAAAGDTAVANYFCWI